MTNIPIDDLPICIKCGKPSTKQCAKCRRVWYCSRECQVTDWKTHKESCISLLSQIGELPPVMHRFGAENCFQLQKYLHSITKSKFITFGSFDIFSHIVGDLIRKPVIGINPELIDSYTATRGPIGLHSIADQYNQHTSVANFIKSEPDPTKYADSTLLLNWAYRHIDPTDGIKKETELDVIEQLNPCIVVVMFDKYININTELLVALTQIPGLYSTNEIIQVSEMIKDVMQSTDSSDSLYAEVLSKSRNLNQYRLEFSMDLYDYNDPDFSIDLSTAPDDIRYLYTSKNQITSKTFTLAILVRKDILSDVFNGPVNVPKFVFDKKLCNSIISRFEYETFNLYYRAFKYMTEHINLIKTGEDMRVFIHIVTYWIEEQQKHNPMLDISNPDLFDDLVQYLIMNI